MDGSKLKELRESKYLSKEELANRIGVELSEIEDWEELGSEPSKYYIERLSEALNLDEDSLKWKLNIDRRIDDEESSDIGLGGLLLGIAAIWGLGKLANKNQDIENDEEENDEEENETTSNINKNNVNQESINKNMTKDENDKYTFFIVIVMFLLLFVCCGTFFLVDYMNEKNAIEAGKLSAGYYKDYEGEDYEVVVEQLRLLGFTNINLIDLDDAGLLLWKNGTVESVSIGGDSTFENSNYYYSDEVIIITYH